jgi:hypothetical protein
MPHKAKTAWRRFYVFLAVSLSLFLAAISCVGIICHGFATGQFVTKQTIASDASASHTVPVPAELKAALAQAQHEGQEAYQSVQSAVDKYQATDVQLQDLVSAHFDDLLQTAQDTLAQSIVSIPAPAVPAAKAANLPAPQSTADSPEIQQTIPLGQAPELVSQYPITPTSPQTIPNPRWQDLENEIVQFRRQRMLLSDTLLPSHPKIQALDLSLSDLESQLNKLPKQIPAPTAAAQTPPPAKAPAPPAALAVAPVTDVFAKLMPRWQKAASEYRELSDQLQAEKSHCYDALNHESAAWQQKANVPVDYIAKLSVPQVLTINHGADPRLALYWCGLLAIIVGALVASCAKVPEAVFQTAAQVRQRLTLTILGFLPRRVDSSSRQTSVRESRWIRRTLLTAELYLASLVVALAVLSLLDHQFFGHLLANPLAACSQKFWS